MYQSRLQIPHGAEKSESTKAHLLISFRRASESSCPTARDLSEKICILTHQFDHKHHFGSSLHIPVIPRTLTSFINESPIFKPFQAFNNNNNNRLLLFFSGPQNNVNSTLFFYSNFGHQLSIDEIIPQYPPKNQFCQSSSSSYDNNNDNINYFYIKNEIQIVGNFMREMVEDSALYMHRLVDCFLQGSSTSLIVVTDSNRLEDFRLVTQEFEVLSQALVYYTTYEMHNNYRDMRLDVDNMSYEELLALEDHIGYVNTGLSEEEALTSLKQSKYFLLAEENSQKEFCSICQKEYLEQDELGILDCSHNFHITCIKQWLGYKNNCPICKSTGLSLTLSLNN